MFAVTSRGAAMDFVAADPAAQQLLHTVRELGLDDDMIEMLMDLPTESAHIVLKAFAAAGPNESGRFEFLQKLVNLRLAGSDANTTEVLHRNRQGVFVDSQ